MESFKRLASRKFLLSVAALVLVTVKPEIADSVVTIVGLYFGGNVANEFATAIKNNKSI